MCERPPTGREGREDFRPAHVWGGSDRGHQRRPQGPSAIVAYAWDTGKIQNRARVAGTPAIACAAGGDALLVGDKQLRLFHLPSLKPAWTHPIGRASARDVAVTRQFIAYRAGDSLDVRVVPRRPPRADWAAGGQERGAPA